MHLQRYAAKKHDPVSAKPRIRPFMNTLPFRCVTFKSVNQYELFTPIATRTSKKINFLFYVFVRVFPRLVSCSLSTLNKFLGPGASGVCFTLLFPTNIASWNYVSSGTRYLVPFIFAIQLKALIASLTRPWDRSHEGDSGIKITAVSRPKMEMIVVIRVIGNQSRLMKIK